MSKSIADKLIAWAAKKGPKVTQEQLVAGIGKLGHWQDIVKQKRLLSSLLKRVDIYKEVEHTYRLEQSKVTIEKEESTGGLTVNHLDLLSGLEFKKFLGWFFAQRGAKTCVTKSSGDHGVDLIVEMDKRKIAVQAKRYQPSSGVGAVAVRDAYAGMKNYDCQAAQVIATTFFTRQAIEEAKKLGVELWDRSRLQNELNLLNVKTETNNGPKLAKPEAKTEKRELRQVVLDDPKNLKNNQVLRVKIEADIVRLCSSKEEPVGIVKGFDAKWIQTHSEKGAVFKIRFRNTKKEGMRIEAEAQWFEVK